MTEQTVAMYCFLDDFLRLTHPQAPHRRQLSDAEILTTALLSARFFGGNLTVARHYMEQHWGMKRLDKMRLKHLVVALPASCTACMTRLKPCSWPWGST